MDELNWETIALAFIIVGYFNDVFDLVGNRVDLVKLMIKGVKWIINKMVPHQKLGWELKISKKRLSISEKSGIM